MYRANAKGWIKHLDFVVLDVILLELSFIISYYIRHGTFVFTPSDLYRESVLVVLISGFMVSILSDVHKNILKRDIWQDFIEGSKLSGSTAVILLAYIFLFRHDALFSRLVFLYFFVISQILIFIVNYLWKRILLNQLANSLQKNHLLVVTQSDIAREAITNLVNNASYNAYTIVGVVLIDDKCGAETSVNGIPIVCRYRDLFSYIQNRWIDEVMIWLPKNTPIPEELLDKCMEMGITTHTKLNIESNRECQHRVEKYAGVTVLTESLRIATPRQLFVKRCIDIIGAVVGLMFTALFTVVIGPIIYFTDPGPIFFSQDRVGTNGRIFRIHKFRSMYQDAEKRKAELMDQNKMKGFMFKMDADPRILGSGPDGTRHGIGWFIRKTSIDEFPQFWNVLKGEMSLVGTRPPTLDEWKQYESHHRARMAVRPGLTGLWQTSGRSDIEDFEEVIKLDMQYINNWNIGMDIRLILKTVGIIFTGKGAE